MPMTEPLRCSKGTCGRGIYDNMKTAVETVFVGKNRLYNRRFLQMCRLHAGIGLGEGPGREPGRARPRAPSRYARAAINFPGTKKEQSRISPSDTVVVLKSYPRPRPHPNPHNDWGIEVRSACTLSGVIRIGALFEEAPC
jgi:hypothetical protein